MTMESLFYILNQNPAPLGHIPGTSRNKMGWQDVSSALGMGKLNRMSSLIARLKYNQDLTAQRELSALLHQQALSIAKQQNWRAKAEVVERLSNLAQYEFLRSDLCDQCKGRKFHENAEKTCSFCKGLGRRRLRESDKYRFAAIEKRNWERRWKNRYEYLFTVLSESEQALFNHLDRQLFSGEQAEQPR